MDLEDFKGKALVCTSPELQVSNNLWQSLNTVISVTSDQFHKIGSGKMEQWYPKKELTNIIGSGMGIEFDPHVEMKEVYGEEKILPDGTKIRKVSGYQCTKIGKKRKPDGDFMYSSPCVYEFNWEDRAEEDFLKDMDNIGQKWQDGNPKAKYNFPDNPGKQAVMRRKHVLELKKFAVQRASTGAELLVIRELTGMPTGFKPGSIPGNQIVVSQICKSSEKQQRESEAHIRAILTGGEASRKINTASKLLTGNESDSKEDIKKNTSTKHQDPEKKVEPAKKVEPEKPKTLKEQFDSLIQQENVKAIPGCVEYHSQIVNDNGATDDVLNWAIDAVNKALGEAG